MYLAAILDVFNRKIIGWSTDNRLSHEVIADALHKAIRQQRPRSGVMFHSDRGTQYTSYAFRDLMERYGFVQSMSSSGNCYDNALMESFFHTLKTVTPDVNNGHQYSSCCNPLGIELSLVCNRR